MNKIFNDYIKEIKRMEGINGTSEMSYYYSFKKLLIEFSKKHLDMDVIVSQQMSHKYGDHNRFCKPDFTVLDSKERIIGIIECKKPNINLIREESRKQIKTYRKESNNFIFTNFYDFRLYNDNRMKQKISLLDKDRKMKATEESNMIKLLTKFLSNSESKYKDKNFVIHGKGLTEKQINRLKTNKTLKIVRNGYEFCVTKSASKIIKSNYVKAKFIKEKFIIGGQNLSEQQVLHLEFHGWVVISRNGIHYLIEY